MEKLPIGLQLYSVRDDMAEDFYGTLKAVKEMGYDGVEFAGLHGKGAEEIKGILDELSLVPFSAHVGRQEMMNDLDGVISTYARIGCKYIAIPAVDASVSLPGASGYGDFLEDIKAISNTAKKYGITLLYHNHDFEFEKVDGRYKLDILYSDTTSDELQTQIDTCWVGVGGENPADYVIKYSGRAPLVHLKDYIGAKSANMYELIADGEVSKGDASVPFELRPVGCGVQDVPAIMKAAEKAGAKAVIVEQDQPSMGKTPLECAKTSIENIKKVY